MYERFHSRDKSSVAMFWRSHDKCADLLNAFVEMQRGPNPLTRAQIEALAAKHPRYRILLGKVEG